MTLIFLPIAHFNLNSISLRRQTTPNCRERRPLILASDSFIEDRGKQSFMYLLYLISLVIVTSFVCVYALTSSSLSAIQRVCRQNFAFVTYMVIWAL